MNSAADIDLRKLSRILAAWLLAGAVLAFVTLRVMNDRDDWVLLRADMPLAVDASSLEFVATQDGYVTIEIEVDADTDAGLLKRFVTPTEEPSEFDVEWRVAQGDTVIAAGDARSYLYVVGMPSLPGRLRRVVMQVPFNRSAAHWYTLGLIGSRTVARGIGRFDATAGTTYSLRAVTSDAEDEIAAMAPVITVRVEPRTWSRHYAEVRKLGYLGLVLAFAGFGAAVTGRLLAAPPR